MLTENSKEFKLFIYYYVIKLFLKRTIFIVQSNYIKKLFIKKVGANVNRIIVSWPGFIIPDEKGLSLSLKNKLQLFRKKYKKIGLIPIAYDNENKNLKIIDSNIYTFNKLNYGLISLLNINTSRFKSYENVMTIGSVSREELFSLYKNVDFMIFTSVNETIGLPIFEFLQTGKPTFVFNASYANSFFQDFNRPLNLVLFNEDNLSYLLFNYIGNETTRYDYSIGEWDKL